MRLLLERERVRKRLPDYYAALATCREPLDKLVVWLSDSWAMLGEERPVDLYDSTAGAKIRTVSYEDFGRWWAKRAQEAAIPATGTRSRERRFMPGKRSEAGWMIHDRDTSEAHMYALWVFLDGTIVEPTMDRYRHSANETSTGQIRSAAELLNRGSIARFS